MNNKDKFTFDKNHPYEYNIAIIILGELCNEGIIDIFDMAEVLIKLRKLYNLPVIDIYGKKKAISAIKKLKTASLNRILKVCTCIRISNEIEGQRNLYVFL